MFPNSAEVGKYFHEMFKFRWDEYRKNYSIHVVNPTKRRKKYVDEEGLIYKPLDFEIFGNISSFGVFEVSRLAVFEKFLRRTSFLQLQLQTLTDVGTNVVTPPEIDALSKIPQQNVHDISKVVKIGVRSVFELIKGSKSEFPDICVKAVHSLLTLLEGLQLEALSDEPSDIINDIFNVLLNIVDECLNEISTAERDVFQRLVEISSASLLSFSIIRGDTGKMLRAISTIIVSKYSSSYTMVLPNAVIELQNIVQSIITGKLKHPSWFTHGILRSSCISMFHVLLAADEEKKVALAIKNIACDGFYLYVYTTHGLCKIGTGYNGTIPRNMYAYNPTFFGLEDGWIGYVKNTLYFVLLKSKSKLEFYTVNTSTLELQNLLQTDTNISIPPNGLLFVDDPYLCLLSSTEEDELIVRYLNANDDKIVPITDELQLKLSQKYFELYGLVGEGDERILSCNTVGATEELVAFASGKEFSLLQTTTGKVFYNCKLGNQNVRLPGAKSSQCWIELMCPKMSTIKQCVIGNEGSIGLLVFNDGSVCYIGVARRGEDGENGVVRRQCSQIKPRKMTRIEGKVITYAACNHGSTALVTDKGELYMFGKDAINCETGTGLVSDLKNVRVRQVALGKVHVVVLTDKGHVYTFGYNGRGQCGRYFSTDESGHFEGQMEATVDDEETSASSDDTYSDVICPKGTHVFKRDKCMICPTCHQCTGYGAGCLASNEEDREPGEECGCGDGDSGCAKCCICKMCAVEEDPEQELDDDNDADDLIKINLFGAVYERNERKVIADNYDQENERMSNTNRENRGRVSEVTSNANNSGNDSMNIMYLSPARVYFRTSLAAVQIVAGLYHTVVLMENGEVYTFGSNALGQLGVSDVNHVGPVRANLPPIITQIAAGSNHTIALTSTGEVYTFGNNARNQLGEHHVPYVLNEGISWSNVPRMIPKIGAQYQQKAVGIGASGDLTYLKINKSLVNRSTLQSSTFVADKHHILLLPVKSTNEQEKPFDCVVIEKLSGNFKSYQAPEQVDFVNCSACYDTLYGVLWSVDFDGNDCPELGLAVNCYNTIASFVSDEFHSPNILDCELAVPAVSQCSLPCYQTAVHVLACLDMLSQARSTKDALKSLLTERKRVVNAKSLRKEVYSVVNRFQALGNSWTYNTHNAVEAIRFSCDTEVLLGGIGLYGGRGHYHVKIKLLDIGYESNESEYRENQIIISTDEIVYECALKQTYTFMFEEPVLLQPNRWYIVWTQIRGSASDCGNSGQSYVITDDEVVFHFKPCLLSNNGTNVSCGQIPQLLYKLMQPEFCVVSNFENRSSPTVHILSRKFSHTVSEDGLKSLVNLMSWCWKVFKTKYAEISNVRYSPSLLQSVRQFDQLVYINQACQHLVRAFIFEMYPDDNRIREKRSRINYAMAELIGDIRELLQNILSDSFLFENFIPKKIDDGSNNIFYKLVKHILKECSDTVVSCFYVFYPTPMQKWIYLCYLLNFLQENDYENDFLIVATLSALYASNIHLKTVFPILLGAFDPNLLFQQNKKAHLQTPHFHNFYPVLSETLMTRTEQEIPITVSSWLYVVEKILKMASQPLKDALMKVKRERDPQIALNSCYVLSKLVAELSAEAMGINDEVQRKKEQMLHVTPMRFRRTNANKSWNTGNGSPDAITFAVDKPGVVIVGIGVFGGSGNYNYDVELLDQNQGKTRGKVEEHAGNAYVHWKSIVTCRGSFGSADYNGKDIVELNFEHPATIRENSKYAIKLRLRGNRTSNGELGQAMVTGPDDTVFTFYSTEMSFNGTSVSRGQIPYIIYYRHPQRSSQELKQKMSIENQSREAIMAVCSRVFGELTGVLADVKNSSEYKNVVNELIETSFVKVLLPLLVTYLSPLAAINAKNACQILKLIESLLTLVCAINKKIASTNREPCDALDGSTTQQNLSNLCTTSPHYSMVESDHPYKQATVSKYIVKFPQTVLWMSLEFDPRSGTLQEEDVLKIYVPDCATEPPVTTATVDSRKQYCPLPRVFDNQKCSWPDTAIILPGNEVIFSLESSSKYSQLDRGTSFGFKCLVIGFEMVNIDGLPRLETELTTLACRCASYLIKKKCTSGLAEEEFSIDGINMELAEAEYRAHSMILNRGLDLCKDELLDNGQTSTRTGFHPDGVFGSTDRNDKNKTSTVPDTTKMTFFGNGSNERTFLMNFINYKTDTSGGRLARWLQPDSFVDASKCEVILPRAKIKCGWPASLAVVTRDQYGDIVQVPDLKIMVVCQPLTRKFAPKERKNGDEEPIASENKPDFSISYKAVTTNRVKYNAITFMKEYSNYSFEELRHMTPNVTLDSEKLSVVDNQNGIYTANWTPKEVGMYSISVTVDGYNMNEMNATIEVKMPPFGITPPVYNKTSSTSFLEKKLKFCKQYSAGLRIRAQPSLQSEQIGIIPQERIVTYIDEAENEDGIWVKLTHECIAQHCKQLFSEAWCLKYNKHYEIDLLTAFTNQTGDKYSEKTIVGENDVKVYQVVKCGVSGHNVRAYPSLKAPTVGMIFAEQKVTSDEQIYNKEGMWIKLDTESLKKYDFKQYDSVWSLAVDKSQIVYLKSDSTTKGASPRKQRSCRNGKTLTPTRKVVNFDDDANEEELLSTRINNQNVANFNVPPTPKKQKRTTVIVECDKPTSSPRIQRLPDSNNSSSSSNSNDSSSDSVCSSDSRQFDNFIDPLEKSNDLVTVVVSSISDRSSAMSSGYQASIETSSDSALIFKSDPGFAEEQQPTLTQTGTQTSPKFYPRILAAARRKSPEANDGGAGRASSSPRQISNVNRNNYDKGAAVYRGCQISDLDDVIDESILRIERISGGRMPKKSNRSSDGNDSVDEFAEANDESRISLIDEPKRNRNEITFAELFERDRNRIEKNELVEQILASDSKTKKTDSEDKTVTINNFWSTESGSIPFTRNADEINREKSSGQNESKIAYKSGVSPSVAQSVRAVFAAFLWHEGLVHDAMTCASFLKFYPELRKNGGLVVKRTINRNKDTSHRYSVEVGLTGNAHHLIKPSTMTSLPSSKSSSSESRESEDNADAPQVPPVALNSILALWNEISHTCFELFTKNSVYSTAAATYGRDGKESKNSNVPESDESNCRKYSTSSKSGDFFRKYNDDNECELCDGKFLFPITYHMRNAHKGCGKSGVSKGYSINGVYNSKMKGNCGEGGRKNSPSYILCEMCRQQYYQMRRSKRKLFLAAGSPATADEYSQVSGSTHLMMKENALFALDLSGDCNKLTPVISTFPRLKTFSCLASFGLEGDVIPNDVTFSLDQKGQIRTGDDIESESEETGSNNGSERPVLTVGRTWKSSEDNRCCGKRYSATCEFEESSMSPTHRSSTKLQNVLKDIKSSTSNGAIDRPIISFLAEYHNLQSLKLATKLVIKKAVYTNYGLRTFDWLLRTVTTPMCLHDIMWWFVASFSMPLYPEDAYENNGEWSDEFDLTRICEHPLVEMALAGEIRHHIPSSFHALLQTIADLMVIFPVGSPLQQMAIKCWGFQFTYSDYNFLHRSKLFVNISKILLRSESEEEQDCNNTSLYESHPSTVSQSGHYVEVLRDVTANVSITVSSQCQLMHNLIDNSTETYWESGEEDRRKMKTIVITCPVDVNPQVVYIHVDNPRNPNHKVNSIMILTGIYADNPKKLRSVNLDVDYCGWVTTFISEHNQRVLRIDCKGDPILRVRQIKVTGELKGQSPRILQMPNSLVLQQRQCESETLKVFRLIIFQVFGELIENIQQPDAQRNGDQHGSSDLKEHMVGILFSRRRLNNLQKQVCTHIVQTIKRETVMIKEEWERYTNADESIGVDGISFAINDSYCFEMLCMVSALSGSDVGRSYLAQRFDLISDLLALLHVGTTRLQRQVVLLLKRVLPEVSPKMLSEITGVQSLPRVDFRTLSNEISSRSDVDNRGILDILLSVIAKVLCVQVKAKNGSNGKEVRTIVMSDFIGVGNVDSNRWYLKGSMSKELAVEVDTLLKDMTKGKISESWRDIAKASIAENILNLANLSKITKIRKECLHYVTFWIGLASLSAVDEDHVEKLSSANWRNENAGTSAPRPLCANHDDQKTLGVMQCNICGLLCLECDRFLHLNRKTQHHERRICKEEEEAIKVDVHEGCGRVKLFWLLALVDSNTFKGVVEFRENSRLMRPAENDGLNADLCRFCGRPADKLSKDNVCTDDECLEHAANACAKVHRCGHVCGGIKSEEKCLPCLHGCTAEGNSLKQDADDMCMICFTEALSAAPSIQLECGHVFHYDCCKNVLLKRWAGPRITFNFQQCPICKRSIYHDSMEKLLTPIWNLMKEVRKKALMRLEYEGCPSNYEDPAVYSMEKYAYYVCFKCNKAYYGGEARCEVEVDNLDFNPEELICGGCSDVSGARVCPKHGTDFLEYKCRYCCSVAVYFCFGTTHFCNACHEDFQKVISLLPSELPSCPAGPKGTSLNTEDCPLHIKHPPTGEEFALGCGVCRTGRNF